MEVIGALRASPDLFAGVALVVGLMIGSFLNVVIFRLPKMMEREWQIQCAELRGEPLADIPPFNLVSPRSACPGCGHPITALQNIPVVSWLVLGGRCAACKTRIPARYPIVEILTGALSAFVAWRFGASMAALGALCFLWSLIALAFIDLDTQLLPDSITLPLVWAGLLFNLFGTFTDLHAAVIGAVAGYLILWTVYWLFRLLTGREGMGFGDFKLLAAIGAWLGWKLLPAVILLSAGVGAAIGITLILLARHGRGTPIPFGPYLALGGFIALIWGDALTRLYFPGA
ncbi:MAG: prepilin peptidase [Burkholderiales bacterium]|nr:prepilin peptidase [Burkholderiales bacterium]